MATLTGSTIAASYDQVLTLPSGGGNTTLINLVLDYNKNIRNIGLSTLCIGQAQWWQ